MVKLGDTRTLRIKLVQAVRNRPNCSGCLAEKSAPIGCRHLPDCHTQGGYGVWVIDTSNGLGEGDES